MKNSRLIIIVVLFFVHAVGTFCSPKLSFAEETKKRIMVVSSFNKEYLWSQAVNKGVVAAFLLFQYLDTKRQGEEYTKNDYVESSKAVIKKLWMDIKRKSVSEKIETTVQIIKEIEDFKPDIILLGGDYATDHLGNHYIDSKIPLVFWGVKGNPLKFGLLDSIERPGHNITGVYQSGHLKESVECLKKLVPSIETFAILSDASSTSRFKVKKVARLSNLGKLPIKLIETVKTNSLSEWKSKALDLQKKVDALFVLDHKTIKDEERQPVDQLEIGAWYLKNIKKPDASYKRQFVEEGILCAVDNSEFQQGNEVVKMAYQILEEGKNPANMPSYAPEKGMFIVNLERAKMLGLENLVKKNAIIDEYIEKALALEKSR